MIDIIKIGYVNDDTTLELFNILLIIYDNFQLHITILFDNLATKNKIILFYLLLHFTYLI